MLVEEKIEGKYVFMAPGVSGDTDDFEQALAWLKKEREQFRESGARGAIYIRLDLAACAPAGEIDRLFEAVYGKDCDHPFRVPGETCLNCGEKDRSQPTDVVALYADGGCILKNPSEIGGTWAFCGVDRNGNRVIERGGVVPARPGQPITNNHMEQIAITLALEEMPDGWSGTVYSDSMVALGRVFEGWKQRNLPLNVARRSAAAVARLGAIRTVLLQGHPTAKDLANGIGAKRNLPVSVHNVYCDKRCNEEAKKYLKEMEAQNV